MKQKKDPICSPKFNTGDIADVNHFFLDHDPSYLVHLDNMLKEFFEVLISKFRANIDDVDDVKEYLYEIVDDYVHNNEDILPAAFFEDSDYRFGVIADEMFDIISMAHHVSYHTDYLIKLDNNLRQINARTLCSPLAIFNQAASYESIATDLMNAIALCQKCIDDINDYRSELLYQIKDHSIVNTLTRLSGDDRIKEKAEIALAAYDRMLTIFNTKLNTLTTSLEYLHLVWNKVKS